jgi:hypothetical protein
MSLVYLLYASSLWMILIYHHCKDNTSSGEQLVAENTGGCSNHWEGGLKATGGAQPTEILLVPPRL